MGPRRDTSGVRWASRDRRLNITLGEEHAEAAPDPRSVAALLDGLPGAYERVQRGLEQARRGETVSLDDL